MTSPTTRAASAGDSPVLVAMRSTRSGSASGRESVDTPSMVGDIPSMCNFLPDIGQVSPIHPLDWACGASGVRHAHYAWVRWGIERNFSEEVTPQVGMSYLR